MEKKWNISTLCFSITHLFHEIQTDKKLIRNRERVQVFSLFIQMVLLNHIGESQPTAWVIMYSWLITLSFAGGEWGGDLGAR